MGKRRSAEFTLSALVKLAIPVCKQAERQHPRMGRGRKPLTPDWALAVLIMVVVLLKKKSKAAQYNYLKAHRVELQKLLGITEFPGRSTYYERYRRVHRLFQQAIQLQGERAIKEGLVDARDVASDKSMVQARGPKWHQRNRQQNIVPRGLRGVDRDSTWGYSQHDGWLQGYSYEVVVSATKRGLVFPLLASVDTAGAKEMKTFEKKFPTCQQRQKMSCATAAMTATRSVIEWKRLPLASGQADDFCVPKTNETKVNRIPLTCSHATKHTAGVCDDCGFWVVRQAKTCIGNEAKRWNRSTSGSSRYLN